MKPSAPQLQAMVDALTRLCSDIGAIETRHGLRFSAQDVRPRIEYFHDAVRAFTSGADPQRLRVERLAYDVSALRYLQGKPLATLSEAAHSPHTQVGHPLPAQARMDRDAKDQLAELYKHYGVLFAALLKPAADRDFLDRQEALNEIVEQCAQAAHASPEQAAQIAYHLNDPKLRQEVLAALQTKDKKKLNAVLASASGAADKELKTADKAHADYGMAQLGLYEAGKDTVKNLASQGFALAGRFVQDAMNQAAKAGRGR